MRQSNFEPADIEIYARGHGVVLKEPARLAVDAGGGMRVLAVGSEATSGNFPEGTVLISPFHQGKVADFLAAECLCRNFVKRTLKETGKYGLLRKPMIGVCVQGKLNQVELQAFRELFLSAGAREVTVLMQTLSEFLALVPEAEQKKYEMIVSISKENPEAYVREQVSETIAYVGRYGYSKEQLIEMIKEL